MAWIQWKGEQGDDIYCWKDYVIVDNIGRNDDLEKFTLRNYRPQLIHSVFFLLFSFDPSLKPLERMPLHSPGLYCPCHICIGFPYGFSL